MCLFVEIGQSSLKLVDGNHRLELPLERVEGGRLTQDCKVALSLRLRGFLKPRNWILRRRAFCAIGARGVSLRRLTLPGSTKDELQRLLALQIENQFPLPPDELAWGYRRLDPEHLPRTGAGTSQEIIVVAVKKEVIEDYTDILAGCGLSPVFTLGALARCSVCPPPSGCCAVLDIGRKHSELISLENGAPSAIRILPWGGENLTRSIAQSLGIRPDEAEKLKTTFDHDSASNPEQGERIRSAIRAELGALAGAIKSNWTGPQLYLTGKSARLPGLASWLAASIGAGVKCESCEDRADEPGSAAIAGLQKSWEKNGACPLLVVAVKPTQNGESVVRPAPWKWAALAGLLAFSSLSLRYVEPLLLKPRLSRKLAEIKTYRDGLPRIDGELSFLQFLKTNQPPYLDAMLILANTVPSGARIDSFALSRGGDLSVRASLRDPQQAIEFRSKLINSGFFSAVVVEEQTPTPDRQKVVVRIIAQWKSASERDSLPLEIAPSPESGKPKPPGHELKPDAPGKVDARTRKG